MGIHKGTKLSKLSKVMRLQYENGDRINPLTDLTYEEYFGKRRTLQIKRKQRDAKIGKKRKPFTNKWKHNLGNARRNKTMEEFYGKQKASKIKNNMSNSLKGRIFSDKHCKNISKSRYEVMKILRKKKVFVFNKTHFDSKSELEIALCIKYQFGIILKDGVNCHVRVGQKEYDFLVHKVFVEFHPVIKFFHPDETNKNYYKTRRQNLDNHGYRNHSLVIIK